MAEIKVSQLPEASEINDADLLMIVQNGTNKKITKANARFASGDEISIGTTEPTEDEKLWINPEDIPSGSLNPITNEYSVAQDKGYSCNYTNNANTYSTSEVKTDMTWIDGKPIYRKTMNVQASTSTQSFAVSTIASNIDAIWIDFSASFYGYGGILSDWEVSGARFKITIDSGNVYYVAPTGSYNQATITFNYTKTTD